MARESARTVGNSAAGVLVVRGGRRARAPGLHLLPAWNTVRLEPCRAIRREAARTPAPCFPRSIAFPGPDPGLYSAGPLVDQRQSFGRAGPVRAGRAIPRCGRSRKRSVAGDPPTSARAELAGLISRRALCGPLGNRCAAPPQPVGRIRDDTSPRGTSATTPAGAGCATRGRPETARTPRQRHRRPALVTETQPLHATVQRHRNGASRRCGAPGNSTAGMRCHRETTSPSNGHRDAAPPGWMRATEKRHQ